jgi:hyperosmotically inducible periplasmic protein
MNAQSTTKQLLTVLAASILCLGARAALSQATTNSAPHAPSSVPADNSKSNKLDPSNASATADAQKNDPSDVNITKSIRKSLMADKSLSTYAHNVKVVTVNGNVTLNGVVRSDQEKSEVEAKAVSVVGQSRVVNDLKVSPKSWYQFEGGFMLHYAIVFFVIALIAAVFGFGGIAAGAAGIAKVLFVIFLIGAIATFFMHSRSST